jgi:hypothetical protein
LFDESDRIQQRLQSCRVLNPNCLFLSAANA